MIALATLKTPGALLICNGYKDREYVEMAILAQQLGQIPIIVLEQIEEVPWLLKRGKIGNSPNSRSAGQIKLKGNWSLGNFSGRSGQVWADYPRNSKHRRAIACRRYAGLLTTAALSHWLPDFVDCGHQRRDSRIEPDLRRTGEVGADMKYLDVGGGLGVDYDGSKTNFYASKNYNVQNYANDIVAEVKEACAERNIPVPTLISESGRAIASHQSVLVFNVLGTSDVPSGPPDPLQEKEHLIIRNLYETYEAISEENYQEAYHDATQFKEEAISLFNFGYLSLPERARAERLYWACCERILRIVRQQEYVPDDLEDLEKIMASIYYINLSVFQSAPDSWAIDQLFPIMPIHRLNEEPTHRATLADLTCDSDGKIDQFIDLRDVKHVLELHALKSIEKESGENERITSDSSLIPHPSSLLSNSKLNAQNASPPMNPIT